MKLGNIKDYPIHIGGLVLIAGLTYLFEPQNAVEKYKKATGQTCPLVDMCKVKVGCKVRYIIGDSIFPRAEYLQSVSITGQACTQEVVVNAVKQQQLGINRYFADHGVAPRYCSIDTESNCEAHVICNEKGLHEVGFVGKCSDETVHYFHKLVDLDNMAGLGIFETCEKTEEQSGKDVIPSEEDNIPEEDNEQHGGCNCPAVAVN